MRAYQIIWNISNHHGMQRRIRRFGSVKRAVIAHAVKDVLDRDYPEYLHRLLLTRGVKRNPNITCHRIPLVIEAIGNISILRLSLQVGVKINEHYTWKRDNDLLLHRAATFYYLPSLCLLLSFGADVNATRNGFHILCFTEVLYNLNILKTLCNAGADINDYYNGCTLLYSAIGLGMDHLTIATLLTMGADPHCRMPRDPGTALRLAQKMDRKDIVRLLKRYGATE